MDETLSQADIDKMLSRVGRVSTAFPADEPTAGPANFVRSVPAEPTGAPRQPDGNSAAMTNLEYRLSQLEESVRGASAAAAEKLPIEAYVQELEQALSATTEQLDTLHKRLSEVEGSLPETLGYAIRRNFVCNGCQEHGVVATKYICTSCGTEHLWGWWPEKT